MEQEILEDNQNQEVTTPPLSSDTTNFRIDELTKDLRSARIISPAYATYKSELAAILLYTYQSFVFGYQNRQDIAKQLEEISIQEMHHFELLGQMLIRLGVTPIYTAYPPFRDNYFNTRRIPYTTNQIMMIKCDIEGEKQAIQGYKQMINTLTNPIVKEVIEHILSEEEEHLIILTNILNELEG